ncbi:MULTISPECIES: efflux RND transporter permease subunit [Geobacter]|uniref:efflux RND transporter permease subunit n=1 Tax=Geobacter TaxID=28231 RepID=UPI0025723F2B|nr:multidrug efflux RND transporter permease subunit [Geobacter sulfurreducens]BEH10284.1 efflux RND transporter permease subunit [Geobacter sulfurreducens subsp. ethanolicus]BET58131.1 efflux RND transporter permease subunit [Geobacter sp. 60473]
MAGYFINRPVFAAVIAIVITLAGFLAMKATPVAQYPEIAPPTVQVSAFYPGATAEVIANTVAAPIEQQVNGVDRMMYMSSTSSSSGSMALTVTFEPGTDPDMAQVNVQNRVNQASSKLPDVVSRQGVTVEKRSQSFMMVISFYSPDDRYDTVYLGNYTNLNVLDAIKRIPGANLASMFPQPDVAMRIWLKPDKMAQLGITPQDVSAAIQRQNKAFGIGQIGQAPSPPGTQQSFVVTTKGLLTDPEEFEDIIIRTATEGSAIVRLKDVARAELGGKDYSIASKVNGKRAAAIVVYQQPGANAIETSKAVRKLLAELKPRFPQGLDYRIVLDTSTFTEASIEKVIHTFFEAVVLVVLVVFLFLQSFRATVIPIIAVPIAIIGTYIGIMALGFSTNMLTLFGMILAIGLVVDDAIIVVENVEHNMATHGLSPMEAARKAMNELAGALIAIVLVLCSVFLPVAFLGGMTGTLYKQFAVTIAISMVISGIVALTLSPAMAARILKPGHGEKKGFFRWFENGFSRLTDGYVSGVRWMIRHKLVGIALFLSVIAATVFLFRLVPGSFVPQEDQGYILVANLMPDAASLERTVKVSDRAVDILKSNPAMGDVAQVDGYSIVDSGVKESAGMLFAALKPMDQRPGKAGSAFAVINDTGRRMAGIREGLVFPINPPSIPGLGTTGGFEFYIQNRSGASSQDLERVTKQFAAKCRERKELAGVSTTFSASQRQLSLEVDRARAELLGIPVASVFETLQSCFGSSYVAQFVQFGRIWQVILQAEPPYRDEPADFSQIFIRSGNGEMIPLSAVATARFVSGPNLLPRFNGFPAAKLSGSQAQGFSSGQAIKAMEEVAKEVLPEGYSYAWAGQAFEEKKAGGTSVVAFVFGLIMVFLILAAQYEKWTLPVGVVLSVPFAVFGALLLTWALKLQNDVYFQVGLVTLVGLAAKNAILIIEFAAENVRSGMSVDDAAIEAARLRLRPIVMTSLAFILGCVPMAIATGAGANSLRAIGTGVIGGMLASTLIASFFVPLFFVLLESTGVYWGRENSGFAKSVEEGGRNHD